MKPEEYLYVCLIFSAVFAVHSGIAFLARRPAPLKLGTPYARASAQMLHVTLARR